MRPKVAIGVEVTAAFIHCAKAIRRGNLWDAEQWPDTAQLPTPACMINATSASRVTPTVPRTGGRGGNRPTPSPSGTTEV